MLKMNLNTNMNSDLTQIIWSKMSVYIRSGCSRAWTKVDGVHTFLCKKISILYVLCTFLALQTSGAHPLLMASTHFFFRTTSLHKTGDQYCTYYHVRWRKIAIGDICVYGKGEVAFWCIWFEYEALRTLV